MSRASKGFADFFPTAPSVLQQKRTKTAQHRKRSKPPAAEEEPVAYEISQSANANPENADVGHRLVTNGIHRGDLTTEPSLVTQEETEFIHGDLLNAAGSASSSSTTSSVFSIQHPTEVISNGNGGLLLATLTPLTNTDSSPPGRKNSPPDRAKQLPLTSINVHSEAPPVLPAHADIEQMSAALTPINSPGSGPLQARPRRGEPKGTKAVYDPELDKKLSSKDKKSRKVQYTTFGEEVCSLRLCLRCRRLYWLLSRTTKLLLMTHACGSPITSKALRTNRSTACDSRRTPSNTIPTMRKPQWGLGQLRGL